MARTIQIINGGTTYNLSDGTYTYDVVLNNAGMPPIRRVLKSGAYQIGAYDLGFRIEPRTLNLHLYYSVDTEAAADGRRDQIYEIFAPHNANDVLNLKIARADGGVRQIDCNVQGEIGMHESDRIGFDQKFVVPLVCPDPIFYSPIEQLYAYDPTLGSQEIPYDGNWVEYPIIELNGPYTSPTIYFGGTYFFLNDDIGSGVTWTIDCRYGYRTIVDGSGNSKLAGISYPQNFLKMGIFPWETTFRVTGGGSGASADITYFDRYLGA